MTTNLVEEGFAQPEKGTYTNVQAGNSKLEVVLMWLKILMVSSRHFLGPTATNKAFGHGLLFPIRPHDFHFAIGEGGIAFEIDGQTFMFIRLLF
mgnify:CR=1 FL=1